MRDAIVLARDSRLYCSTAAVGFNVPSSERARARLLQLGIAVQFNVPSSDSAGAQLLQLGIVVCQ